MMDDREDRLDALLRDAARDYNAPPPTPKGEMWERIAAAHRSDRRTGGQTDGVVAIGPSARPSVRLVLAIAALLALGVAIGRLSVPHKPVAFGGGGGGGSATALARPSATAPTPGDRSAVASQLATSQHFSQVETFLTEFSTGAAAADFTAQASDLLCSTRLLLDSKRVHDQRTRKLLEDLELVLVQIATFDPKDRREERDFIADGLTQSHLRSRIRNAVLTGPAIRM